LEKASELKKVSEGFGSLKKFFIPLHPEKTGLRFERELAMRV